MEIEHGLTMLRLDVITESGAVYMFAIDRRKTVFRQPGDANCYALLSSGPIAVGLQLRGYFIRKKFLKKEEVWFESPDKVVEIIARFRTNMIIGE